MESRSIPLSRGLFALIDEEDAERVLQFKWFAGKRISGGYDVRRNVTISPGRKGKRTIVLLHRFILGVPSDMQVDHVNGDPLDNRRSNLRLTAAIGNARNCRKRKDNSSGIKGVDMHKGQWRARIAVQGKSIHVGYFASKDLAAKAYDLAAIEYHGDFASPNSQLAERNLRVSDWRTRQVAD